MWFSVLQLIAPIWAIAPASARMIKDYAMTDTSTGPQKNSDLIRFVEHLKSQWMATIDALHDPLMIVSKTYAVVKANKAMAESAGQDVKNIIGQPCFEVFAGRSSPCPECQLGKTFTKKAHQSFDLKNDAGRYFEVSSQPLFTEDGAMEGAVHVYLDRTESKRLTERLAQQEKLAAIGLLAGGVAHEINNPLGGILIFSQMLLKEMNKASVHYQDVVEIEAATQRCKSIVDSLLDFARQNSLHSEDSSEVDLNQAINDALKYAKSSVAKDQNYKITKTLPSPAPLVPGSAQKITQVFQNLIQNAMQAMPKGGELEITGSLDYETGLASYHVKDTGPGIPKHNLAKVFDPFFTTKDPGEGTGLGLALSYSIVAEHGGQLTVDSEVGVGSQFVLELPVAKLTKG